MAGDGKYGSNNTTYADPSVTYGITGSPVDVLDPDVYGSTITEYGSLTISYAGTDTVVEILDPYVYGSTTTQYGSTTIPYGIEVPPLSGFYTFSPPSDGVGNPSVLNDARERRRNPLGWRLMRHYGSSPKVVNVYKLADGTYTTVQPIYTSINHSVAPPNMTIVHTYYGGTVSVVDAEEAQRLTDAGFTPILN